jgi:hypothetical protein
MTSQSRAAAGGLIGDIVLAFASLEQQVGLCLRACALRADTGGLGRVVDRLDFRQKMQTLHDFVHELFHDDALIKEFRVWYLRVDQLRLHRNGMVHGCWDPATESLLLRQAAQGNGVKPGKLFTVDDLRAEYERLDEACAMASVWQRRLLRLLQLPS